NLGCVLWRLGRLDEAETSLTHAIAVNPHLMEAHNNLGGVLEERGQLQAAADRYRIAISVDPRRPEAYCNLGSILHRLGKFEEASRQYISAINGTPSYADAWSNLGAALQALGNFPDSEKCLRRAVELGPNNCKILSNLADVLRAQGKASEAIEIYRKAIAAGRENVPQKVKAALAQDVILDSREAALTRRAEVMSSLDALMRQKVRLDDPHQEVGMTNFHFAYQGVNDLELATQTAKFYLSACPKLGWTAPYDLNAAELNRSRLRIGIVSTNLYEHTIGKFYQGIIQKLSRERFEVVVMRPPHDPDPLADTIGRSADRNLEIPYHLERSRELIAAERCDLLFYPDIGMAPLTYFLAFARLAPVQCVSWGHPVTTGIPAIDYFISAKSIEPADAASHYSERLIMFDRLPSYYFRPRHSAPPFTRKELGFPEDATLYLCPQSLFKLHPDFDVALATLLRHDPKARLLLLSGVHKYWDRLLSARIARGFPDIADRVMFVPRIPQKHFFRLLMVADVVLDPPFFGGGNTSYEAFAMGLPIVTWPGEFMRGRVTEGCYRQMGFTDLIADGLDSYVEIAHRLANDRAWREQVKTEIAARAHALYEDTEVVREFEKFFIAAVETNRRGERISNWE
ncbi:MAG TPA: tetratricopeptide repeat protein, partial [Candidatus Binataceae bacterium]|nr:tetratricopeptide repeat protein [Candidatus Binataceae bacterium]